MERAHELADDVRRGDLEEALQELVKYGGMLPSRPPALEIVYQAVLEVMLPEQAEIDLHAGRLFYCLKLQPQPAPVAVGIHRARLDEESRETLVASFRHGASSLDTAVQRGLAQGILETLWREAAEEVRLRGVDWILESWLAPTRFDHVFERSGLEIGMPSLDELVYACSGYPKLIPADPDELKMLNVQMVKRYVLPRLLARRWPEAVAAAEHLVLEEPLLKNRQDFHDALVEARKLIDAPA
jgi:hypothetical protein